jgi:(p)ppGpp synthase/HD superfamily hydrolase
MADQGQAASAGIVFAAIEFAARAHAGQYRKGTRLPYLIHPLSVARILIEQGLDDEVVAAGVLHDTLEDTPTTPAELRIAFGERVTALVETVSEQDKSISWEERKRNTVATIQTASVDAIWVECADKLDNIRSIAADLARAGELVWERFNSPMEKQRWYYRSLAEAFTGRLQSGPGAGLARAFAREVAGVFGAGSVEAV